MTTDDASRGPDTPTPAAPNGDDPWSREELSSLFPWVRHLPNDEFQQFIGDLYAWQNTAAIHSDPALDEQMRVVIADAQSATRDLPLVASPMSSEWIQASEEGFTSFAEPPQPRSPVWDRVDELFAPKSQEPFSDDITRGRGRYKLDPPELAGHIVNVVRALLTLVDTRTDHGCDGFASALDRDQGEPQLTRTSHDTRPR